ncbi:MAG TPA: hypothetical protein VFX92_05395 [Candidatus Krumholzibacteria bacterium]|nr:hypothetical protein [Candidatus Krumholzibacteria bacterium]
MRRFLAVTASILALVCACQFPGCPKGVLEVAPQAARPGQKVHLHQARGNFQSYDSLRVVVGRLPAYVRIAGNTDADFMVPISAPPGAARIKVLDGHRVTGTADLRVLPAPSVRILVRMDGNAVTLLATQPSGDPPTRDVPSLGERLSVDLTDETGTLLHTVSILHPLKTAGEVSSHRGDAGVIRSEPPDSRAEFWIRMPSVPGARFLRVYSAPAGVSLADSTGRANRLLLEALDLKVQQ